MDVQNSRSAFRKLRLAAGLTQAEIAKALNVPLRAKVKRWDRGGRPRWRYMPPLARFFKITLAEAVRLFWGEIVGSLCTCGCGGKKIFPNDDGAQVLPVSLPPCCEKTRKAPRILPPANKYPKLCRDCSFAARGKAPPRPSFLVSCVGYQLPGMTVPDFKCPAPHQRRRRPSQLKDYPSQVERVINGKRKSIHRSGRTTDDGVHAFVNEAEGKERCGRCAAVGIVYLARKERAIEHYRKAKPWENAPIIRNPTQLKALEKECFKLSYEDESGAIVTFNPDLDRGRRKKKKTWPLRGRPVSQQHRIKLQFEHRSGGVLPGGAEVCLRCPKLVVSHGKVVRRVHPECFNNWQRERGLSGKHNTLTALLSEVSERPPVQGRPTESFQARYSWAKRHAVGESLHDIAKGVPAFRRSRKCPECGESHAKKQSIAGGIDDVVERLDPDLVPEILRPQALAILRRHFN